MIKFELHPHQAEQLAHLIDVAIRAKGLEVADIAMQVIALLRQGVADMQQQQSPPT